MPIIHARSAFCDPTLRWNNQQEMHRRCRGRFLHHKSGDGAGRQNFRAICDCPCHAVIRATIPPWTPADHQEKKGSHHPQQGATNAPESEQTK